MSLILAAKNVSVPLLLSGESYLILYLGVRWGCCIRTVVGICWMLTRMGKRRKTVTLRGRLLDFSEYLTVFVIAKKCHHSWIWRKCNITALTPLIFSVQNLRTNLKITLKMFYYLCLTYCSWIRLNMVKTYWIVVQIVQSWKIININLNLRQVLLWTVSEKCNIFEVKIKWQQTSIDTVFWTLPRPFLMP